MDFDLLECIFEDILLDMMVLRFTLKWCMREWHLSVKDIKSKVIQYTSASRFTIILLNQLWLMRGRTKKKQPKHVDIGKNERVKKAWQQKLVKDNNLHNNPQLIKEPLDTKKASNSFHYA